MAVIWRRERTGERGEEAERPEGKQLSSEAPGSVGFVVVIPGL